MQVYLYRGRRCTASLITRHGAFTRGKEPLCPLNGRPSEPQSWSGHSEEEEFSSLPTEFRTQYCPGRSLVGMPTALSRVTHVRSVCSLVWQHAHTRVGQWTRAYRRGSIWQGHWHLCLHHSLSKTALRPTGGCPEVYRPDGDTEHSPLSRIGLDRVKHKRSCLGRA